MEGRSCGKKAVGNVQMASEGRVPEKVAREQESYTYVAAGVVV